MVSFQLSFGESVTISNDYNKKYKVFGNDCLIASSSSDGGRLRIQKLEVQALV